MNILTIVSQMCVTHKFFAPMVFFALLASSVQFVTTASANHDGPYGDDPITNVRLCHVAGGSGNYNDITVSVNGAGDPQGHSNQQAHSDDIIPPYHWSGGSYPGQNWVTGQATWENGCVTHVVAPDVGAITILKDTDSASGDSVSFDFTGNLGAFSILGDGADFEASTTLLAGESYTITEIGESGWTFDSVSCDAGDWSTSSASVTVNLAADDDITCTFHNTMDDVPPPPTATGTLVVNKIVVGGQAATSSFSFAVNGVATTTFEADGSNQINDVATGTYTITEVPHANYEASYGNCIAVEVVAGQITECTITNTYRESTSSDLQCTLESDDVNVVKNQEFTLSWTTGGASHVEIDNGIGNVALNGSHNTSITENTTFTLTAYESFDEEGQDHGKSITCDISIDARSSSGGGGRTSGGGGSSTSDEPEDEPEPEVLGEQVSAVPAGAPNTGAGGAATTPLASLLALFGMLSSLGALRVTRNG